MDEIFLRGMQFFGRHGVLREETTLGQRFVVHLRMKVDLEAAAQSDDVTDTVDYAAVYGLVRERVEGQPFRLLERLAGTIADDVLSMWPRVESVAVEVEKPGAPIPGVLDTAGVRVERDRDRA